MHGQTPYQTDSNMDNFRRFLVGLENKKNTIAYSHGPYTRTTIARIAVFAETFKHNNTATLA